MGVTPLELAKVCAMAADSKKAEDLVVLELTELTDVCDYFIIANGQNSRQVDSIVDEIREKVHTNCGISPLSCEGREALRWVLIDYGSVVVHIFVPEMRDFYRLENLWADAPRLEVL